MDPRRLIAQLCVRFKVSMDFGRRLQPLVEKAARADPRKRRLLLEMVERSFAEEARRSRELLDDWRALNLVAGMLHGWNPPTWFGGFGRAEQPPRSSS